MSNQNDMIPPFAYKDLLKRLMQNNKKEVIDPLWTEVIENAKTGAVESPNKPGQMPKSGNKPKGKGHG